MKRLTLPIVLALALAAPVWFADGEARTGQAMRSLLALLAAAPVLACSAFLVEDGERVLAANNEDSQSPATKIWFVPASGAGQLGRMYLGYDNLFPQGGMNEAGLFFDGFSAQPVSVAGAGDRERFPGNLALHAMETCSTVDEVVTLHERYDRSYMDSFMVMFGDTTGDAAIVEGNVITRKQGRYQVVTSLNRPSGAGREGEAPCLRYDIPCRMLEESAEVSIANCRRILAAMHMEGVAETVYSNICDLRRRTVHLYHFHNYENERVIDLEEELRRGAHAHDLPDLFPTSYASEAFREEREKQVEEERASLLGTADPRSYGAYVGIYEIDIPLLAGFRLTITQEGDRLLASTSLGRGPMELLPKSAHVFFQCGFFGETTFAFGQFRSGKAQAMTMDSYSGSRDDGSQGGDRDA